MKRNKIKNIYYKFKNKIWILPTTLVLMPAKVFAAGGSISTAEVNQATENVKNAIIKLAMPIGRYISFRKYCNNCFKNDS